MGARIMKERFHAKNPRAMMLRFHTQTAGCTLTAQQPDNNVVRVAFQALSAVLGGTQSLHTNSRDEAFALPSTESVQIALRTQQIIGYETGAADTVDPLAGSYYVEALTNEIERSASEYIKKIDEMGGAVRAVECGFIEQEIQDSAYRFQKAVETGDQVIVGMNRFQTEWVTPTGLLKVDPTVREMQVKRWSSSDQSATLPRYISACRSQESSPGNRQCCPTHFGCSKKEGDARRDLQRAERGFWRVFARFPMLRGVALPGCIRLTHLTPRHKFGSEIRLRYASNAEIGLKFQ